MNIDSSRILPQNFVNEFMHEVQPLGKLSQVTASDLEIDLERLDALVTRGKEATAKAKDQSVILVLGPSGSGKSTAINYLAGAEMAWNEETKTIRPKQEFTKVGDGFSSTTSYPTIVVVDSDEDAIALCDNPGFGDNRGLENEICSAICIHDVFFNAAEIAGIAVCIPYSYFCDPRLQQLIDMAQSLAKLVKTANNYQSSLLWLITKPDILCPNGSPPVHERLVARLQHLHNYLSEQDNSPLAWIFDEMIKDQGRQVRILDLLRSDERREHLDALRALQVVREPQASFDFSISDAAAKTLTVSRKKLAENAERTILQLLTAAIDSYANTLRISQSISELEALEEKVQTFKDSLADLQQPSRELWQLLGLLNMTTDEQPLRKEIEASLELDAMFGKLIHEDRAIKIPQSVTTLALKLESLPAQIRTKLVETLHHQLKRALNTQEFCENALEIGQTMLPPLLDETKPLNDVQPITDKLLNRYAEPFINAVAKLNVLEPGGVRSILRPYLVEPFTMTGEKEVLIQGQVPNLALSQIIPKLWTLNLQTIEQIAILAPDTLFFDSKIDRDLAGGKDIAVICTHLVVTTSEALINTTPKKPSKAAAGLPGAAGLSGGNVLLVADVFKPYHDRKLEIVTNGGDGGDGGDGQNGSQPDVSMNGKDGDDAQDPMDHHDAAGANAWYFAGTAGKSGQRGNSGTNAGAGGYPGPAGIFLGWEHVVTSTSLSWSRGKDGDPGEGGTGGKGGKHGYCTMAWRNTLFGVTQFAHGYFNRVVSYSGTGCDVTFTPCYAPTMDYVATHHQLPVGPRRQYASDGERGPSGRVTSENVPSPNPQRPLIDQRLVHREFAYLKQRVLNR